MKRLVLATALLVGTTVLGATAEAQQVPKSGKYTGKYASYRVAEVSHVYELEKGHVFYLGRSDGVFFNDVADGVLDKPRSRVPLRMTLSMVSPGR